jgi:chorismate mutase
MARPGSEKGVVRRQNGVPALKPARDEAMLKEVRSLLSKDRDRPSRMRRLERMERAAQVWVNGRPVGVAPQNAHLYETYD